MRKYQEENITRFNQLRIGDRFEFVRESESLRYSGLASGPWVKISSGKYRHVDTLDNERQQHIRIGSTKSIVEIV